MEENTNPIVVYIEDDMEMIDLVSLILNRRGYQVHGAHGGRNGLDLVVKEIPDLILLDPVKPRLGSVPTN
mgnify:CR=1 FL=1